MKKIISVLLLSLLVFEALFVNGFAESVNPTDGKPIYTKDDLNKIRYNLSGTYTLMQDITFDDKDFSEDGGFFNGGKGWIPIGTANSPFTGAFNGNGHGIYHLRIDSANGNDLGLFGAVNNAVISDMILTGTVTGNERCGILAGSGMAKIENCFCAGELECKGSDIGGIMGQMKGANCRICNCYFNGSVTGQDNVGGILGSLYCQSACTVSNCVSSGRVNGQNHVGGIVGSLSGDKRENGSPSELSCLENNAALSGEKCVGGIVGLMTTGYSVYYTYVTNYVYTSSGMYPHTTSVAHPYYNNYTINNCFNTGSVNASDSAGGIIGHSYYEFSSGSSGSYQSNSFVRYVYNTGDINAENAKGAFIGTSSACYVSSAYYLDEELKVESSVAKTAAELSDPDTFKDWDFEETWSINEKSEYRFPVLKAISSLRKLIPQSICDHERTIRKGAKPATCTADGATGKQLCLFCNMALKQTETIAAFGHALVSHPAREATCVAAGWKAYVTCERCDYSTFSEIPATGKHKKAEPVEKILTEATCGAAGKKQVTVKCSVCGKIISQKDEKIPATGQHTSGAPVETVVTRENCGRAGEKRITTVCTVCGAVTSEITEMIPVAGNHIFDEWSVSKQLPDRPTSEEARICVVCGHTETRDASTVAVRQVGDINGDGDISSDDARLTLRQSVKLENYPPESQEYLACDADADGSVTSADARMILRASVKLEKIQQQHITHFYEKSVTKPASCNENGQLLYTCTVCGKTTEKTTDLIPHTEVKDPAVAATCKKEGKTEGSHCSVCGEVIKKQNVVKKKNHKWDSGKETGKDVVYTCSVCGSQKKELNAVRLFRNHICNNGQKTNGVYEYKIKTAAEEREDHITPEITAVYDPSNQKQPFYIKYSQEKRRTLSSNMPFTTIKATFFIDSTLDHYELTSRIEGGNSYKTCKSEVFPGYDEALWGIKVTESDEYFDPAMSGYSSYDRNRLTGIINELANPGTLTEEILLALQTDFDKNKVGLDIGVDFGFNYVKRVFYKPENPVEPTNPATDKPNNDSFTAVSGALAGYNKMAKYVFTNGKEQTDGTFAYQASKYTTIYYNNKTGVMTVEGKNSAFTDQCVITLSPSGGNASVTGKTKADAASGYIYAKFTGTLTTASYNGKTGSGSGYRNNSVSYSSSGIGQAYALSATELSVMETVAGLYYSARDMGIEMSELGFLHY